MIQMYESQVLSNVYIRLWKLLQRVIYLHWKKWDLWIQYLLFADRELVQETLRFSPFELVFGHTIRWVIRLIKEKFLPDFNSFAVCIRFQKKSSHILSLSRCRVTPLLCICSVSWRNTINYRQVTIVDMNTIVYDWY